MTRTEPEPAPVALVTGAARRIGASIATALHERGLNIVVHCRRSTRDADALVRHFNAIRPNSAHTLSADLADEQQARDLIEQSAAHFGALDVLVNNASGFYPTPLEAVTTTAFDDLMGSNLKGPLFLSAAAAPWLRRGSGAIVNITDIHARHPLEHHVIYCAAKAALESLTRSLARELAPQVRVNAVAPGAILWPESAPDENEQTAIINATELKRLGAAHDIAGAVIWLALDAQFVTGQVIAVDGGRMIGP